ncbi:MAG: DUF2283 domain-containing protein [Candidatus Parvarchaeota archaeon]|nr:DUF2283 domain-containing protein [Candidatus Jingweiarchaeum tengchongense]MCW1305990.1 DUF2283 domain-containing protein [Candidatus Jingweiarchaeum tengchongense]
MNKIAFSKYLPLLTRHIDHTFDEKSDALYLHFDNNNPIATIQTYIQDQVIIQLDRKEMPISITIYKLHETIKDPQAQELLQQVPSFVISTVERILGIKI